MNTALITLTSKLAATLDMGDGTGLIETLKATAFKSGTQVTDAQMTALMVVANQYGLNPWTKEIYAFPDKKNGIIPVVSVDGWARIINSHPAFDGMDFNFSEEMITMDGANSAASSWTECVIHRKDRSHPTIIREYLDEVYKAPYKPKDGGYTVAGPWQTHPKRFSRHKAMIQCARMAFGFGGIYDDDEAARINESAQPAEKQIDPATGEITSKPKTLPAYTDEAFEKNLPTWRSLIESGKKTADQIIKNVSLVAVMTEEQKAMVLATVSNVIDME